MSVKSDLGALIIITLCTVISAADGGLQLGIGSGIQSYPRDLDPYDRMERRPVLYPRAEILWTFSERVSIGCVLSRTVVYGVLDPRVDSPQWLTVISSGLFGELDFSRGPGFFGAGAQIQGIMGIYHIGPLQSHDNGFGVKVYGVALHDLSSRFSAAVRTGVQRAWVRAQGPLVDEELTLDSFAIDVTLYFDL